MLAVELQAPPQIVDPEEPEIIQTKKGLFNKLVLGGKTEHGTCTK